MSPILPQESFGNSTERFFASLCSEQRGKLGEIGFQPSLLSDIIDSLCLIGLFSQVCLVFLPARAPGGVPPPQACHQAFWVCFRLLPDWACFTPKGLLFFWLIVRVHDNSIPCFCLTMDHGVVNSKNVQPSDLL